MQQRVSEASLDLTHDDFCEVITIPGDMVKLVKDHLNGMSDEEIDQIVKTTAESRAKGGETADGSFWATT